MPVDLFLQDRRLPALPEEALPGILALASGMGLATHWDPMRTTLYVDSPLRDRRVICQAEPGQPFGHLSQCIETDLARRIQAAGGFTASADRRPPVAAIYLRVDPSVPPAAPGFALAVRHGRLPRGRRLGNSIAAHLRAVTDWPVTVSGRWSLWDRRIIVHLVVPPAGGQRDVCQQVAEGIWRGLMEHWSRPRRAVPMPSIVYPARPVVAAPPAPSPLRVGRQFRTASGPLRPVVYRPLRPGVTDSPALYSWSWTIGASAWEVVHQQPAQPEPAAAMEAPPDAPEIRDEPSISPDRAESDPVPVLEPGEAG